MTPDRAREVIRAQSQYPYWGNYEKFMTVNEVADVRKRFANHPNGNITFAGIVQRISRSDYFNLPPDFDDKDAELARERLASWNERQGPRVGDWVDMPDGTQRRFTHNWGDSLQTTCGNGDNESFYFASPGGMSYSGGLDPSIPVERLQDTGEFRQGRAWFFHHDHSGANRGVYFTIPCRVYKVTA